MSLRQGEVMRYEAVDKLSRANYKKLTILMPNSIRNESL